MTEDRCDFLFSTGEYRERDVRDDWGGIFDLMENHVEDVEDGEDNIATKTASRGGLNSGGKNENGRVSGGGDIGSALDAVVELAEDLLHNDKKTEEDEESVEEPMQRKISRAGSIPKNWESDSDSSKEEKRISTHSRRRRIRRNRRQRNLPTSTRKRKGNLPTYIATKRDSLPVVSPPSGRSDSGRSPAGRRKRKRLPDSPDSRLREGVSGGEGSSGAARPKRDVSLFP